MPVFYESISDSPDEMSPVAFKPKKPKFVTSRPKDTTASPVRKRKKFVDKTVLDTPIVGLEVDAGAALDGNHEVTSTAHQPAGAAATPATATKRTTIVKSATRRKYVGPKLTKVTWHRDKCVHELQLTVHGALENLSPALDKAGITYTSRSSTRLEEAGGALCHITFIRETTSKWNHAMQTYVEGELHTEREKIALVVLDAETCPVYGGSTTDFEPFFKNIEQKIEKECIFIVEGYHKLERKEYNAYNRVFQQKMKATLKGKSWNGTLPPEPSPEKFMRRKADILRSGRRVVYAKDRKRTTAWIVDLLKDIAVNRYMDPRAQKIIAQRVRMPKENRNILKESLMYIPGVGKRVAENHCSQFKNMAELFAKYNGGGNLKLLLESNDPEECL